MTDSPSPTPPTQLLADEDLLAPLAQQGFDQEAAAVIMARLATHKMEAEEDFDATRWVGRRLGVAGRLRGGW